MSVQYAEVIGVEGAPKSFNLSHYKISGHAMRQYATKCFSNSSLLLAIEHMHQKLQKVFPIDIGKSLDKGRSAFIDDEGIVYIVDKQNVVTAYPKERIFKPNLFFTRKCRRRKHL